MTVGKSLAALGVAAAFVAGPATLAFADTTTCDAYSGECTTVEGTKVTRTPTTTTVEGNQSTLPFTGGEIVLMSLAGGAAIGGGVVLVAAGRRRRASAQPA